MGASLLEQLNTSAEAVGALPVELTQRVVDFLVRWEAHADALACLDAAARAGQPPLPALHAAALHGLGHAAAAIDLLERSLAQGAGLPVRLTLVELLLAAEAPERATHYLDDLLNRAAGLSRAWYLAVLVHLARGDFPAPQSALDRLVALAPESRYASLGALALHRAQGDVVTAAAYGAQALNRSARDEGLSVAELVQLRAFFQATDDPIRVRIINERLIARFNRDLAATRAALHGAEEAPAPQAAAPEPAPRRAAPTPVTATGPEVIAAERRAMEESARRLFGYPSLLPGQAEVVAAALRGEHVLAVLPTGAGKSLCYQLPAFSGAGVTLVISPLIALMKDQVDNLPDALRRQAIAISSMMDGAALRRALDQIAAGQIRLVYAAPERLRQIGFLRVVAQAGLARLVIDEAHCVSVWGHDFRPDYLHLRQAHRDLGAPPVLAMTATAPPRVRQDIERQLLGTQGAMRVLVGDIFRPNLQLAALRVRDDDERIHRLVELAGAQQGCGIVYARSRRRCEEVAEVLRGQGIRAAHYHAGIDNRDEVQDRFMRGEVSVIVATVAFGMGIDKRDIRFILHDGLPNSVEGYYQEVGRAGRDGQHSLCVLIYGDYDEGSLLRLAGRGQMSLDTLRKVYGAIQQATGPRAMGFVPLDVVTAAAGDSTTGRVALSMLEQVGLLRRRYDAPRTVSLQVPRRNRGVDDPAFFDFMQRMGLDRQSAVAGEFGDLLARTAMQPEELEQWLLAWQAAGWLRVDLAGRDAVIELLDPPARAGSDLERMIADRTALDQQRVRDIADFARTRHCRHGYLADYLGGHRRRRCGVCDNCGATLPVPARRGGPDFDAQARAALLALAEQAWGRRNLVRLLAGDPAASERAQQSSYYGALRERTPTAIGQLVESLEADGLISARELDHGGVVLELTSRGRNESARGKGRR
ncbi:MAG: RecQ family ATP-dependent DNA helicase [Caldilinea sp.]|nr:RecQ family ATP-dependent DNA helicase [Caldilinea sp.]